MFLLPDVVRKQPIPLRWHAPNCCSGARSWHLFHLFYQVEIR